MTNQKKQNKTKCQVEAYTPNTKPKCIPSKNEDMKISLASSKFSKILISIKT